MLRKLEGSGVSRHIGAQGLTLDQSTALPGRWRRVKIDAVVAREPSENWLLTVAHDALLQQFNSPNEGSRLPPDRGR